MIKGKSIIKYEIFSAVFSIALGVLLHFLFDWLNKNSLIGIFSAVNESIWEHLKILFVPMLITLIVGNIYFKEEYPHYITIKTKGIIIALATIVIVYYTYTGIIGKDVPLFNIILFGVAAIIGELYTYKSINKIYNNNILAIITLLFLSGAFILFTFNPPKIGIFKDPVTKTYGINNLTKQKTSQL